MKHVSGKYLKDLLNSSQLRAREDNFKRRELLEKSSRGSRRTLVKTNNRKGEKK